MAVSSWIRSELKKHHIPFEEFHHTAVFTAQELAQREHTSGHKVAKLVVVIADGHPIGLVLPASRKVVLHRVREVLSATYVRLASEGELRSLCHDCEVGAAPPLPHWPNLKLWMDESMKVRGNILLQAGTHEDAIFLNFDDWYRWAQPEVASFTLEIEHLPSRESKMGLEEESGKSWV